MTNTPISLQDLRRSLYVKAKAERTWRFWGLYVHVCKRETLQEAYEMAKENNGAPGIDGVKFEAIEESGVESFLQQIRVCQVFCVNDLDFVLGFGFVVALGFAVVVG